MGVTRRPAQSFGGYRDFLSNTLCDMLPWNVTAMR